jgi:hypothetical protein
MARDVVLSLVLRSRINFQLSAFFSEYVIISVCMPRMSESQFAAEIALMRQEVDWNESAVPLSSGSEDREQGIRLSIILVRTSRATARGG